MYHITKQETYNTGGGCMVDFLHLSNGKVLCISDEYVGLYNSVDDMLEDDGTKCIQGFWTNDITKQFEATWGEGYATKETRTITLDDVTKDNGYPQENILIVQSLLIGDTADLSDIGGVHTIKRIK